jgi:hypothetical protein
MARQRADGRRRCGRRPLDRRAANALAIAHPPAVHGRERVRAIEVTEAIDGSVREERPVYLNGDIMR